MELILDEEIYRERDNKEDLSRKSHQLKYNKISLAPLILGVAPLHLHHHGQPARHGGNKSK